MNGVSIKEVADKPEADFKKIPKSFKEADDVLASSK
jgi:hypothetical protein